MSYYHGADDLYRRSRTRSPGPGRYNDMGPTRSRSPDYTRGSAPDSRDAGPYGGGGRSPSPYNRYSRRRASRSPYGARHGGEPDRRNFDRFERERDFYEPPAGGRSYEYERERERYGGPDDRYRSARDRPPANEPYGYDRDRGRGFTRPDEPIPDPLDSPALLPFKQFAHIHRLRQARLEPGVPTSDLTTHEMFNLYKRYKVVYTARSARRFWEEKRDTAFFVEKYGLGEAELERRRSRRRMGRQGKKRAWLEELSSGKIDGVVSEMHFSALNEPGAGSQDATIFSRSGEPTKISSDSLPIDGAPNQLLVMRIPPNLGRRSIEEELATYTGFKYLALGEAHANKGFYAIGWGVFEDAESASEAKTKFLEHPVVRENNLQLDLALRGVQIKFRSAPSGSGRLQRLAKDLKQAKATLRHLEAEDRELLWRDVQLEDDDRQAIDTDASAEIEKRVYQEMGLKRWYDPSAEAEDDALMQIYENTRDLASDEERAEVREAIKKQLDLHLDILREVYHCDYYSSTICDFAEELDRRARAHFRRVYPHGESEADREGREHGGGGGGEDGPNMGEEQWAENLDRKHALLLNLPSVDIAEYGGVDLDQLMLELATPFTRQDDKEKHRCIVEVVNTAAAPADEGGPPATKTCDKLFRALVFVQKHVCNKHKDVVERELGEARRDDILYLNNYVRDPTRVMPPLSGGSGDANAPGAGRGGRANGHGRRGPANWDDAAGQETGGRMGLIRMGASTYYENAGRDGGRRRSASPPLRNGRGGGRNPRGGRGGGPDNDVVAGPPIHLGSGIPPPPLHLRLGNVVEAESSSPMAPPAAAEPLPPAPRPLDPRAARGAAARSYQDLDTSGGGGGDGAGEVMELEY